MAALIFLGGAALFGIGLVRRILRPHLSRAEIVLWGMVAGWSLATAATYLVARLVGHLTGASVWAVGIVAWLAAVGLWLRPVRVWWQSRRESKNPWPAEERLMAVLLCFFALIYVPLFDSHMLRQGPDGGLYSGGDSALYDTPFHSALATSFAYGQNFPPIYTAFPPARLLYPCLPDFLTAILLLLGLDLHAALVMTAVPLALALTGLFFCFALRLSTMALPVSASGGNDKRRLWAAGIATLLFFFNGGLGFVYFFMDWRASGRSIADFMAASNVNYTSNPAHHLAWPNIITDMLLPQRTSLFGLALGLIIVSSFAVVWSEGRDGKSWSGSRILLAAGVAAGLLPYFHSHSYLTVGLISLLLFIFRPARVWLLFWIPAILLAIPELIAVLRHIDATGFVRFLPGWRGHDEPNWLLFWILNFGLPGLLFIPAWLTAARTSRWFYLAFVIVLLLALLVVLSPNDYDNLKLMYYWSAATSVFIGVWLARFLTGNVFNRGLAALIVVGCTLSGALAVSYEGRTVKQVFSRDAIAAAEFVKNNTVPHSIFLTAPSFHHPVLSLAGRAVVRGPTSWLWSHGYPFVEREADVRAIYRGRDDALELLRYYRVDYIYLGEHERCDLAAKRDFFDRTFPVVYETGAVSIYDARAVKGPTRHAAVPASDSRLSDYPLREYSARLSSDPAPWITEFPEIGYRLYSYYKALFGRTPRYLEFSEDLRELWRGLYVGGTQWRGTVEANERRVTDNLVERAELKTLSDEAYIRALYQNARLTCSGRDCADLSGALTPGGETRSSILRRIAGKLRAAGRDYTAAYVLIHYFAFFHRDPDQAPDRDLQGYEFWRQSLDRTRDYRGITRAFLESTEYRDRAW